MRGGGGDLQRTLPPFRALGVLRRVPAPAAAGTRWRVGVPPLLRPRLLRL